MKKLVIYYRLSKKKKGMTREQTAHHAHGIDAQKALVAGLMPRFGKAKVLAEITEIETGTSKRSRPKLQEAIAMCKLNKATLVIAKLDRLARNVAFVSSLMESKVEFICADNPEANNLTIHILAAVAENEARTISQRTKDALAAAKAKGVKFGTQVPGHYENHLAAGEYWRKASKIGAENRAKQAKEAYAFLLPQMKEWYDNGDSYATIAERLNELNHTTTRGGKFDGSTVMRIFKRGDKSFEGRTLSEARNLVLEKQGA